jgi:putative flippase GtrA
MISSGVRREAAIIQGHIVVSLAGFAIDAALLTTSIGSGLSAPVARLISLFWAMQATFALNGLYVFRRLRLADWPGQWTRYMASNGLGNIANYAIFVALVAGGAPVVSERYVALSIGALVAWLMNYCSARLWVFRRNRLTRGR